MAIEFQCAYCTAMIRVADGAAGKVGKCPKCGQQSVVPQVVPPEDSAPAAVDPPPAAPAPPVIDDGPRIPAGEDVAAAEPAFPGAPPDFARPQPEPVPLPGSYARKLRRRARRRKGGWLLPLLCGLVLVGGFAIYFGRDLLPLRLEGELHAVQLSEPNLAPGLVEKEDVPLPDDQVNSVLEDLTATPLPIKSNLMEVEFRGSEKGLEISIDDSSETEFYRVDLRSQRPLMSFAENRFQQLDKPRRDELHAAVREFFTEWRRVQAQEASPDQLQRFRDSLGLNSLRQGLGYHLMAVFGGAMYPCVYYDSTGYAYFLLPPDAQRFELQGRIFDDETRLFPGHYRVKVVAGTAPRPR